jgi:exodeoxyribonuclease VII small subunit
MIVPDTAEEAQPPEPPPAAEQLTFEGALAELQAITRRLEDGKESLEATLCDFERGVQLLRRCYALLDQAEQRIELFLGFDEQGAAEIAPFDASATMTANEATAGKRRKPAAPRKSASGNPETDPRGLDEG